MSKQCMKPPKGWRCTRHAEHEGPCAAVCQDCYVLGEPCGNCRPPAPCVELKRKVPSSLVQCLKDLILEVEEGKVIGVTFLCNKGNETVVYFAGEQYVGAQLAAWEDYKFKLMLECNTVD